MQETKILVVDDEKEIADLIEIYLVSDGYKVYKAYNAADGLDILAKEDIKLVLLDIMMPGMDGLAMCRKIRETSNIPIIILSAKSTDLDKILGLGTGADDYVTKPFNPLELVARVKGQLRRYIRYNPAGTGAPASAEPEEYDLHGLYIDKNAHKCTLYGKEIALTPLEFSILWYLCSHHGRVVSSEELFEAVWGEKYLDSNNTVMSHIARLREKLGEAPRRPKFIKTVWGVGYTVE